MLLVAYISFIDCVWKSPAWCVKHCNVQFFGTLYTMHVKLNLIINTTVLQINRGRMMPVKVSIRYFSIGYIALKIKPTFRLFFLEVEPRLQFREVIIQEYFHLLMPLGLLIQKKKNHSKVGIKSSRYGTRNVWHVKKTSQRKMNLDNRYVCIQWRFFE